MTTQLFVVLVLGVVLAVSLGIALRTWFRLRGKRVVICPETLTRAAVTVDVGHAAATAVWEKADLRLETCSRWPERKGCDEACVSQIVEAPGATLARTMAAHYFEGKRCAICQRPIDPPAAALQPGFMHPVSHESGRVGRGAAAEPAGCVRVAPGDLRELYARRIVPLALPGPRGRSAAAAGELTALIGPSRVPGPLRGIFAPSRSRGFASRGMRFREKANADTETSGQVREEQSRETEQMLHVFETLHPAAPGAP